MSRSKKVLELINPLSKEDRYGSRVGVIKEQDFKLYDGPGAKEANKDIADELDRLADRTVRQIDIILKRYKKLGAEDTTSALKAYTYFIMKMKER